MVIRLGAHPESPFPPVETALLEPDGLLAWGGDLQASRLLNAYRKGVFPWYSQEDPILWWSPSRRCVLDPASVYVSRRLERLLKQGRFTVTADTAFAEVVAGCALPRKDQPTTWITEEMAAAYQALHQLGYAHSVEVWQDGSLAGGIYGVDIGRMFFGESMFSKARDASKVALVSLCRQLEAWDYILLDCQVSNPHLQRQGAREISREKFCTALRLNEAFEERAGSWQGLFGRS